MKTAGICLSFLCLCISLITLWAGYVVTFGLTTTMPSFESEPPEGYAYWMNKEYWHDVRSFAVFAGLALISFGIPLMATLSLFQSPTSAKMWTTSKLSFSIVVSIIWVLGIGIFLQRDDFHWIQLIPICQLLGSLFAVVTFHRQWRLCYSNINTVT